MIEEIRADKRWNDVCRNETANREKNLAGVGYRMNRNRNICSGCRRLTVCHGNPPRDGLSGTNRIRFFQDKPFHVRKSGALRCSCHETQENKRQKRNADLDDSVFICTPKSDPTGRSLFKHHAANRGIRGNVPDDSGKQVRFKGKRKFSGSGSICDNRC